VYRVLVPSKDFAGGTTGERSADRRGADRVARMDHGRGPSGVGEVGRSVAGSPLEPAGLIGVPIRRPVSYAGDRASAAQTGDHLAMPMSMHTAHRLVSFRLKHRRRRVAPTVPHRPVLRVAGRLVPFRPKVLLVTDSPLVSRWRVPIFARLVTSH
jgi:hypothetical protein